jgi:hypothetical protein
VCGEEWRLKGDRQYARSARLRLLHPNVDSWEQVLATVKPTGTLILTKCGYMNCGLGTRRASGASGARARVCKRVNR